MTSTTSTTVAIRAAEITPATAPASETAQFLSMIERMARDPASDIDRIERMVTIYERVAARNARAAFDAALAAMQPELPIVPKRATIRHGDKIISKYALWEDIAEPVARVTARHGFSLRFSAKRLETAIEITAILGHRDGHREELAYPFPIDAGGAKSAVQAVGSTMSYGKRYTACLLLNIITTGEDDDGRGDVEPAKTISEEQADKLLQLIEMSGTHLPAFCAYYRVRKLTDMTVADCTKGAEMLLRKIQKNNSLREQAIQANGTNQVPA